MLNGIRDSSKIQLQKLKTRIHLINILLLNVKYVLFIIYVFGLIHTTEIPRCEILIQCVNLQRKRWKLVFYELKNLQKTSTTRI